MKHISRFALMGIAVSVLLSSAVSALASGVTYELLHEKSITSAASSATTSGCYTHAFNVPSGMHLSMLAVKVACPSAGSSDSLRRVGIEVFPMTAVGPVLADSTGLGNDVDGNPLRIRNFTPDSMAFGPIDMDDSNTKLDGFFCTTLDSASLSNGGWLVMRDSTWTTGTSNFDSTLTLGQRGNWQRYVSSRVIYSELLAGGKKGLGSYGVKIPLMALARPINASEQTTPKPIPGGPSVRADAEALPYTWFYMPFTDAYGSRIDVNRLMCVILNRTATLQNYVVSVYAICSEN